MPFGEERPDDEDVDDEKPSKAKRGRPAKVTRDTELSDRPAIRSECLRIYHEVEQGYIDQRERADETLNYWELYDCKLSDRQFYSGNSKIFVPITNNAIEARKTRFTNQIFPQSGRNVEVITNDIDLPQAIESLLEGYVTKAKLRTQIVPALLVAGDVEGQWSIYVGWREHKRYVAQRVDKPITVDMDGVDAELPGETEEEIEEDIAIDAHPYVEVIPDTDLCVLPQTADSIEDALYQGGSVTIMRRWTKGALKRMAREGEIDKDAAKTLQGAFRSNADSQRDTKKKLAEAAGVVRQDGVIYALGYETWTMLKVGGKLRLCRIYFGGENNVLGCKLNPFWNDKCPIISGPVTKTPGVFKGIAPSSRVMDMQVLANDAVNEGADTAHFSAMPIIMTDPEKNPNYGTMILGLAAVWATSPKDTQFAQFPALWKDMFQIVASCKNEIFQTLGVNPSMIPMTSGNQDKNPSQAEIANEQQVDMLTTADAVTAIAETILSPLLGWFADLDHQFRDRKETVRVYGEFGLKANMQEIPPIQAGKRYQYRWLGVEAARNAGQMQQQIAGMNVLRGIPPELYPGYRLELTPVIVQMVENLFGPRLAPLVFVNIRDQLSVAIELENELLGDGMECVCHPGDDDQAHMMAHIQFARTLTPGSAAYTQTQAHIVRHQGSMQMKAKALMDRGVPGVPGSPGGSGPGLPGSGAQPAAPNNMNGPDGMIPQDQMTRAGAVQMPRKM